MEIRKEDFVYQYLLKYNEYEKKFDGKDAVTFWKNSDGTEGTSGLVFMVLRNALVHNTLETIIELEKKSSFFDILVSLEKCKLESEERIKYMSIFFDNEKIKRDLENKNFNLINTHRSDIFKLFQRKYDEFYISIFFSHTNLLFSTTVSTYNQITNLKEYFEGYYIETELYKDQYILKFFKNDESLIIHNVTIYIDKNFKNSKIYQSIEYIEVTIIKRGDEPNIELKYDSQDLEKLENNEFKEIFDNYCSDSTIRCIAPKIKTAYTQLNSFLHVIGIQNDI